MKKKALLFIMAYICLFTGFSKSQNGNQFTNDLYASTAFLARPHAEKSIFETNINLHYKIGKTEEHWRKLRNNGIVLTSLGAACIGTGIALIQSDIDDIYGNADGTRSVFGFLGIAGGALSVGGGVTMWAIGNNRLKKIRDFSLITTGKSIGIAYKL